LSGNDFLEYPLHGMIGFDAAHVAHDRLPRCSMFLLCTYLVPTLFLPLFLHNLLISIPCSYLPTYFLKK
jgi:hypothetical protein